MDFMFSNPTMLDDLDFLYKSDTARKLMFYYQVTLVAFQIQLKQITSKIAIKYNTVSNYCISRMSTKTRKKKPKKSNEQSLNQGARKEYRGTRR